VLQVYSFTLLERTIMRIQQIIDVDAINIEPYHSLQIGRELRKLT